MIGSLIWGRRQLPKDKAGPAHLLSFQTLIAHFIRIFLMNHLEVFGPRLNISNGGGSKQSAYRRFWWNPK
jgi:hypothetical protein